MKVSALTGTQRFLSQGMLRSALLGYAVTRLVGLLVLWAALDWSGTALWQTLTNSYDSQHLLKIATVGYDHGVSNRSSLAFFPLYPLLTWALGTVLGVAAAGLVVSWLAGLAAAAAMFAIGRELDGPRAGVALAILWGALPHGITQSLAYSESLFTALAAWALYALIRRQWLSAGVLTFAAGLTRPTASALIAVVGLAAIYEIIHRRGRGWRVWVAGAVAPLGWLGYLLWAQQRSVVPGGWFGVQRRWGSRLDGGTYTLQSFLGTLSDPETQQMLMVSIVLVLAVALIVVGLHDRLRGELLAYGAFVVALSIATGGYYHAKARLIVPAFTLLIPIAIRLAGASRGTRIVVLTGFVLFSAYYGSYLMVDAPRSP